MHCIIESITLHRKRAKKGLDHRMLSWSYSVAGLRVPGILPISRTWCKVASDVSPFKGTGGIAYASCETRSKVTLSAAVAGMRFSVQSSLVLWPT